MIARIWYGYTTPDNADAYEALLKTEIFPGIVARNIAGFRRIELLRGPVGEEVEFATVMWFDSLESVKAFAGADYETAVVTPKARAVLKRFEGRSRHYDVREERVAR
ncbi:MAG: antibiotic biosynthesis monooxygenase [Pseudolabrys sp.]